MPFTRLVGIVPLGIGLTVIGAQWLGDSPLHQAPFFFKLMATFIALPFVMIGIGALSGKLTPESRMAAMRDQLQKLHSEMNQSSDQESSPNSMGGYQCKSCGAALAENADVSPHGDVKCEHCGRWFNIHKDQA